MSSTADRAACANSFVAQRLILVPKPGGAELVALRGGDAAPLLAQLVAQAREQVAAEKEAEKHAAIKEAVTAAIQSEKNKAAAVATLGDSCMGDAL